MSRNFELMQQSVDVSEIADVSLPIGPPLQRERPRSGELDSADPSLKLAREEVLKLVQRIFLAQPSKRLRTVVFGGVDLGDESAKLCADVARTLAQRTTGAVCFVDADSRSTFLPRMLGASDQPGLADAIRQGVTVRAFTQRLVPDNLSFLSFGTALAGSSGLWNVDELRTRLAELLNDFEYVLISVPSVMLDDSGALWGAVAHGVVLVVEANLTHREVARKVRQRLQAANAHLIGVVFNNRTFPIPAAVYSRL